MNMNDLAKQLVTDLKEHVDVRTTLETQKAVKAELNSAEFELGLQKRVSDTLKQHLGALVDAAVIKALPDLLSAQFEDMKQDLKNLAQAHDEVKAQNGARLVELEDSFKAVSDSIASGAQAALSLGQRIDDAIKTQGESHALLVDVMTDVSNLGNTISDKVKASDVSIKAAMDEMGAALEQRLLERCTPGKDGLDGAPGEHGRNGIDGRDAAQIEILAAIDEAKVYPRGTYAKHNGGLWRSFETTHGMRGWECLVNGIVSVDVMKAATRGFDLVIKTSDGAISQAHVPVAGIEFKGQYSPSAAYEKGDLVTYGGSLWHCGEDAAEEVPGTGTKWAVAAKRGRDGKSTVKTEKQHVKVKV